MTGSFEKRDEKTTSVEGSGDDSISGSKSRCGSGKEESCFWTSDNNETVSPVEKKAVIGSVKLHERTSTGLSNLQNKMLEKGSLDSRSNCNRSDSTSIASLWTAASSSPSPPPALNCSGLDLVRKQYTTPSMTSASDFNRRKLECLETKSSDEDFETRMSPESGDPSFCGNDAAQGEGSVHTPTKIATNSNISGAASTFMGPDTVLFGQVLSGVMTQGDKLVLGPLGTEGVFSLCSIQSVRVNDVPVRSAVAGQTATMVLKEEPHETSSEKSPGISSDDLTFETGTSKEGLDRSSSVSMNSLSSGLTMSSLGTLDSSDSLRVSSSISQMKSSPGQGQGSSSTSSLSAGSGLVLLSPNFKPVAHWEFEVSATFYLMFNLFDEIDYLVFKP